MSSSTVTIVLALDDAADTPSGSAAVPGREPLAFHGWLGLAAAIDALRDGRTERPSPETEGEPS